MAPEPTEPTPRSLAAHLGERLLDSRIVVVGGQIDDALANTVCSQLLVLDSRSQLRSLGRAPARLS
jgi:ATP-dependent Clp protease protease subunit